MVPEGGTVRFGGCAATPESNAELAFAELAFKKSGNTMQRVLGLAIVAIMMACGFAARAEETEFDPAKVSESLKAIFQFGWVETKKALNANTVTLMSGTIGGTYVQFGA